MKPTNKGLSCNLWYTFMHFHKLVLAARVPVLHPCVIWMGLPADPATDHCNGCGHNRRSRFLHMTVPAMAVDRDGRLGLRMGHSPSCQWSKQWRQKSSVHLLHSARLKLSSFAGDWHWGQGRWWFVMVRRGVKEGGGFDVMNWILVDKLESGCLGRFWWLNSCLFILWIENNTTAIKFESRYLSWKRAPFFPLFTLCPFSALVLHKFRYDVTFSIKFLRDVTISCHLWDTCIQLWEKQCGSYIEVEKKKKKNVPDEVRRRQKRQYVVCHAWHAALN